jgi:hypothetical protein
MGCAVAQVLIFYLERIRRIDMPGIAHLVVKGLRDLSLLRISFLSIKSDRIDSLIQ